MAAGTNLGSRIVPKGKAREPRNRGARLHMGMMEAGGSRQKKGKDRGR